MQEGRQLKRLIWLVVLLILALAGLGYRLVDLQVLRCQELSALAQKNAQLRVQREPRRGDILDVKGNPLATSIQVKRVCANPEFIGNRQPEVARVLAPLLGMSEAELVARMQRGTRLNKEGQQVPVEYVRLKEKVPVKTWELIQTNMLALSFGLDEKKLPRKDQLSYQVLRKKSIFAQDDQERVYPSQGLAAHVVGFVGTDNKEFDDRQISETAGKDGIELTFNEQLAGERGWRLTEKEVGGSELVRNRKQDVEAKDGFNVVLTIDSVVQHILESAMAEAMQKHTPISISGVVVRPKTGEILALATLPTFNPNENKSGLANLKNRVISDFAEPGSTFKIVVVSGALNDGVVSLADKFDCESGYFHYAGRVLRDDHPHAELTTEGIITKSSNIGAAKIGIKLGANRLNDYIRSYGFGEVTGIPLPGEVSAAKYVPALKNWGKLSLAQLPMGHGICTTRMQMAMAMCAIANKGVLMRPMLVDRLEYQDHQVFAKYTPQPVRRVIKESTAALMVKALKTVVTSEGTAPNAAVAHYVVAGKTGTARKVEHGVYVAKYFSSFIGFFPADDPEVCISITLDEPKNGHYGGTTAGPVFAQVAQQVAQYLNIPPEDGDSLPVPEPAGVRPNGRPNNTQANARN